MLPFREIFAVLFFVSVGMLVDPRSLLANIGQVLALTTLIVVGKAVLTLLLGFVLPAPGAHDAGCRGGLEPDRRVFVYRRRKRYGSSAF